MVYLLLHSLSIQSLVAIDLQLRIKLEVAGLIQAFESCFEMVPHSGDSSSCQNSYESSLTSHSTLNSA